MSICSTQGESNCLLKPAKTCRKNFCFMKKPVKDKSLLQKGKFDPCRNGSEVDLSLIDLKSVESSIGNMPAIQANNWSSVCWSTSS